MKSNSMLSHSTPSFDFSPATGAELCPVLAIAAYQFAAITAYGFAVFFVEVVLTLPRGANIHVNADILGVAAVGVGGGLFKDLEVSGYFLCVLRDLFACALDA